MKIGIVLTIIGGALVLASAAYIGWGFVIIPLMDKAVDWAFVTRILLHGLVLLVPGVILLYFGIQRVKKVSR